MRRLELHRRKQVRKNTFLVLVLIVGAIYLFFKVGLPILVNSSVFIANLFGGGKSETRKDQVFASVEITDLPAATNSAEIVISGYADNFDTVEVYLNDYRVNTIDTSEESEFSELIGELSLGENSIYLLAKSKKRNDSKKSEVVNVTYLRDKPKLEITEPKDGDKTLRDEIKVAGSTDKGVSIRVQEALVVVKADGSFETLVKLKEGENTIRVVATDAGGNTEEKNIKITYEK